MREVGRLLKTLTFVFQCIELCGQWALTVEGFSAGFQITSVRMRLKDEFQVVGLQS